MLRIIGIALSLSFTVLTTLDAQIIFENAKAIDQERYGDIRGNPYYFEDWVLGEFITNRGERITDILLNYNGYSRQFEAKKGNQYVILDEDTALRIQIAQADNSVEIEEEMIIFQPGLFPKRPELFCRVWYTGVQLQLIEEFNISLSTKTVQNVGKTEKFKQFMPRRNYYLKHNGKISLLKLNKKGFYKLLGQKTALESFMKAHDIDLKSPPDLVKVLQYYESELL